MATGADIQHKDELGTTALHAAGWAGNREVIGMLLERGLDPNQADEAGFTPLMNAVSANNEGSVQALLAAKANVNAANTFGGKVARPR